MPGYTKEQLAAKGATVANYIFCTNCSLYWHKRSYEKHLRPSARREIEFDHPVWQSLLNEIAIPFEFTVPAGPRAGRAAAKQAMKAGTASTARDAGASAQAETLKKHHVALLERRARLDEEIRQAERELGLTPTRPPPTRGGSRRT